VTLAPALVQVQPDTRSASTTASRLRTAAHKLTSCGEFSRRSEQLLAPGAGVAHVQALGAWLQLWVGHARVDGTVWLTAGEAAEVLGVAPATWRRWSRLLVDAELLAPHGRAYLVPDPAAMEGCAAGKVTPGGWRSLRRSSFEALAGRFAAQGVSGAKRAGALGLFAVVLLRHTYGRAGIDVVQPEALPALYELLDRRTVSTYLELLGNVLTRPSRGRLAYAGRGLLEHGWEAVVSPLEDVSVTEDECPFPPSHAHPLSQVLPIGQDPPPGEVGGTLVDLLTLLDRQAPGAATAITRHRLAKALLRAALLEVGRDAEVLAYELTRSSLADARDLAGVIAHRVPDVVDALRIRSQLRDARGRAERQAYAIEERRLTRAHAEAQHQREQAAAAAEQDRAAAAVERAAGEDWPRLLEVVAAGSRLHLRGRALEASTRAAVRQVAAEIVASTSVTREAQGLDEQEREGLKRAVQQLLSARPGGIEVQRGAAGPGPQG